MFRAALGVSAARAAVLITKPAGWERSSYDGSAVSLFGGLYAATGALVGGLRANKVGFAATCAVISGAVAGGIDDHLEDSFPAKGKGFAGHIGALRAGKVTSGLMKIGTIGTGAAISAAALRSGAKHSSVLGWLADTALIAGSANLINLLDLRPGRALKASLAVSALLGVGGSGAAIARSLAATSVLCLPEDLMGRTMLGDLGANAVGAQLGTLLAVRATPVKLAALSAVLGLTALSEKVSFSEVIETTPVLREIDALGRSIAS
ncbi:MAG: beta-carotene 15,15'-monooxygenase [Trueperella sp.]|nr:beta-carotene 15,15'-monooxygenase [Trueperella sp.]